MKLLKCIFIILSVVSVTARAQTLAFPSFADNLWTAGGVLGINTALIDVGIPDAPDKQYPYKQLAACAYDGGPGGGGGFVVTDFRSGFSLNFTYPFGSGNTMASAPDVTWGNKAGSDIDFILAVAFRNNLGQVEVDYFDVHYVTAATFTVTYHSSDYIFPDVGYAFAGTVHIDVSAHNSNIIASTALPFCDRFFLTYDESTFPYPDEVYASYGSLNAYSALLAGPQRISMQSACAPTLSVEYREPDVAGIERATAHGNGDIACITATFGQGISSGMNQLFYAEWDPALFGCAGLSYLKIDNSSPPDQFRFPRIDANDNQLAPSVCDVKIACEVHGALVFTPGSSGIDVAIYSPPFPGSITSTAWIDMSTLPPPTPPAYLSPFGASPGSYYHFAPAVAYGTRGGTDFLITECTNLAYLPPPNDFFMMSPIGKPCLVGVTGPNYYEVPLTYPSSPSNHANSVSTPCNHPDDTSVIAWTDGGNIYYKRADHAAYAFKHATGANTGVQGSISIYPNPAGNHITVNNLGAADRCSIKNVLGQEVMNVKIADGSQDLNISRAKPGMYFISFF